MATTRKTDSICAFRLEDGIGLSTVQALVFYGGSTILELGSNHAMPYESISVKPISETKQDSSIDGAAFMDLPVQTGKSADIDGWAGTLKYIGFDRLLYWMFGYEDGGTSPQSLGGGIYSHLFELDQHERHITAYRTAEQTAGDYSAADFKNRCAVLGIKRGTNDFRYPFFMCNGFGFSSSAGEMAKWTAKGLAYREDRGSYNSGAWTFPSGYIGSANSVLHHHATVSLKPNGGAYVELGVTSITVNVDIPLQKEQDTETGLYPKEPVMNGQYDVQLSFTLSRHSVDTYLQYRDSLQECVCKIIFASGSYEFGLYFPSIVIAEASVSEDSVANTPLVFKMGYTPTGGNPFSTECGSHTLIQNGPFFIITKNTNSQNEMRRE